MLKKGSRGVKEKKKKIPLPFTGNLFTYLILPVLCATTLLRDRRIKFLYFINGLFLFSLVGSLLDSSTVVHTMFLVKLGIPEVMGALSIVNRFGSTSNLEARVVSGLTSPRKNTPGRGPRRTW